MTNADWLTDTIISELRERIDINVSAVNKFFHCFACKESGDAFAFVMKLDGISFPEAVRMLAECAGFGRAVSKAT